MTEYLTEDEQVEILKKWIKEYSAVFLIGIAVALIVVSGWNYWQARQEKIQRHASMIYDEMLAARSQNRSEEAYIHANKLFSHYSHTVYAQMAALEEAKEKVLQKNYTAAAEKFNWVLAHSKIAAFKQIARIRLARILITDNKLKESLSVINKIDDNHFQGLISEVTGDVYYAMHDLSKAREAYRQALKILPNAQAVRPLLQMKYDNLLTAKR